jgi:DnaJ-class molecular chaperone
MEMPPLEIKALAGILDDLDYYQLLHVAPSATRAEIRAAYHQTSRTFHPDAARHLDADVRQDCGVIAKRITEAYCVLRDPRRRKVYDAQLSGDGESRGGPRMQLAEAEAAHAKQDVAERKGQTPQGRQFYQKAEAEIARQNWAGAIQNLQMALTFEKGNPLFEEKLADVKRRQKEG